jgi:ketosteroid isomerase-like protein
MRTYGLVAAAAIFAAVACQPAETPQQMQARMDKESAALKDFATSMAPRWHAWFAAGQADSVANIFMEDGQMMDPNVPAAVGRAAIKSNLQQYFSLGKVNLTVQPQSAVANGPIGIEVGTFTQTFTPNRGAKMPAGMMITPVDTGKYVIHWQQVNGAWQIAQLIDNSNMAVAMPAAAKPAAKKAPAKKAPTRRK